jgi:hypothetical protein
VVDSLGGRLLEFLGVALGAVIVCVGAIDTKKVVMEVGVCGRVVLVAAKSIANGWVGRVAEADVMGVVVTELGGASCAPWLALHIVRLRG